MRDSTDLRSSRNGRKPLGQRGAVRDDNERCVSAHVEIEEECADGLGGRPVEIAGRLVAQHQQRIADQSAGDCGALLLAARQFAWTMVEPIGKANL